MARDVTLAISARGVMKSYPDRAGAGRGTPALDQVSFTVAEREFVSILGPSGCGKSTMLRLLAGLLPHEGGAIEVLGAPVSGPRSDVGLVFQTSNLLPWLSVSKNLRLGVEIRRGGAAARALNIDDMVQTLGLSGFERAFPHQLSGGMRHRVAIGQALLMEPALLLMDEPFGALDALTRDTLNMELLRLWQQSRKTVVLVTHSIAEAILLSDRVLVMSARPGRIVEDVAIDLPRPRDAATTRLSPRFAEYVVKVGRLMGVG